MEKGNEINENYHNIPAEKAEKDQKYLYGFSHFEYENTGPKVYYASRLETKLTSTKPYNLKTGDSDNQKIRAMIIRAQGMSTRQVKNMHTKHFKK